MSGPGLGYEILGAVKVKDGLFIGDELAAQDLEFVVSNKVTRVINCCGRQVPNHWESIGVVYLTYYWVDAENQVILDQRDVVANETFRFIEEALTGAESVLIHSQRGQSRSCCVLSAYMMKKYNWGLRKTMEFLSFRRPDMNLKPTFLQQLSGYERRLMGQSKIPFSLDWNDADFSRLECEELLLRNTYINSQMGPLAEFHSGDNGLAKPRKLLWADNDSGDKVRLERPAGADIHNPGCMMAESAALGAQPSMRSVLKKFSSFSAGPAAIDRQNFREHGMVENPEVHHPPPAGQMGGVAAIGALRDTVAGMPRGPPEVVPTAWAAEGEGVFRGNTAASSIDSDGYPRRVPPPPTGVPAAHEPVLRSQAFQGSSGGQAAMQQQRGPATNMRDSLSVSLSRRESPEPGTRPKSRDPSPKTSQNRRDQQQPGSYRGESPGRYPRLGSRNSSPAGSAAGSVRGQAGSSSAPPSGNLGLGLGGVRSVPSSVPAAAQRPNSAGGMGAFRGGPVKAKAINQVDVGGHDGGGSLRGPARATRPSTAPMNAPRTSSRPASPLGATNRSGSGSRPASPSQQGARAGGSVGLSAPPPPRAVPNMGGYPTPQRSSSYLRRAPSPTPAFNRANSPSKPRWH